MSPSPLVLAGLILVPFGGLALLTSLVYFDAKRVGLVNPSKWAAITLLTGGAGVLVYFFERSAADDETGFAGPHTHPGGTGTHEDGDTEPSDP